MLAASWASPLIVEDRVYIGDEEGDITVFKLTPAKEQIAEFNMESALYTTPIVANDSIFIANRNRVYAIQEGAKSEPQKK